LKWWNGYCCEKCGHDAYFETKTRKHRLYECKKCRYQETVIVGTVMEKTRTDLIKWFLAIYLIAHDKRGVSATRLSEELEVSYKTAWLMLHKIRQVMRKRDENYTLAGIVELDDAFFGAPSEGGKRGRGTDKTKVLVGLSLNKQGHPLFLKMKAVPNIKGETLIDFAENNIQPGSTISSDAYHSYRHSKMLVLSTIFKYTIPKEVQTIYTGYIPFFQMPRLLLVEHITDLTQSISKPI
jgi:transposase-like protein